MTGKVIVLHHARRHELEEGVHLWDGRVELRSGDVSLSSEEFTGLHYGRMVGLVSEALKKNLDASVVFRRTDNDHACPVLLGDSLRDLLREDSVGALRMMDPGSVPVPAPAGRGEPMLSGLDVLAESFGERVYCSMMSGSVEDPLTGEWRSLSVGPTSGWRIRGQGNVHAHWLPIRLEGVDDVVHEANDELSIQQLSPVLATCRWCSVRVEDLLAREDNKFFLPRRWNDNGSWIGRSDLQRRLDVFEKDK